MNCTKFSYIIFCPKFLDTPNIISVPTHTKNIFTPCANFYHFPTLSVKIGSISSYWSSRKHQSQHHAGCLYTGISSLLISLLNISRIFKFIMPSHKSGINNGFKIIFLKLIIVIKVCFIKIYSKNTHFISGKCDFTNIFIKKEYIIVE